MISTAFLSLLLTVVGDLTSASTCAPNIPSLHERIENADAVFIGVVLSDYTIPTEKDRDREAVIQVKKVFKGEIGDQVTVQYLVAKPDHCDGSELVSLSVGIGKEKIFYVKKVNDRFLATNQMGVRFAADYDVRQELASFPIVRKPKVPWWDIFGWTK